MRRYTALKRVLIREKKEKRKKRLRKKGLRKKKREVKDEYRVMGREKREECETEEP